MSYLTVLMSPLVLEMSYLPKDSRFLSLESLYCRDLQRVWADAFLLSHFLIRIFLYVRPRKTGGTKFLKPAAGKFGTGFLNETLS
jgi:hypothetical protein